MEDDLFECDDTEPNALRSDPRRAYYKRIASLERQWGYFKRASELLKDADAGPDFARLAGIYWRLALQARREGAKLFGDDFHDETTMIDAGLDPITASPESPAFRLGRTEANIDWIYSDFDEFGELRRSVYGGVGHTTAPGTLIEMIAEFRSQEDAITTLERTIQQLDEQIAHFKQFPESAAVAAEMAITTLTRRRRSLAYVIQAVRAKQERPE